MSIAFNYVAGGLRSAVIVSAGPAVTNTATGVLVAHYADGVRHDLIMNALGGRGIRVQRPGEMGRALSEAFASNAPTCIDVVTNGNVPVSQVI